MEFICACASDDGENFVERHFGEARYYFVYKVSDEGFDYIKKISNISVEEKTHADPIKAKSVSSILKRGNVQVVITRRFGPNVKRVKIHFVPVIIKNGIIEDGLKIISKNLDQVKNQWLKEGNQRKALVFKIN